MSNGDLCAKVGDAENKCHIQCRGAEDQLMVHIAIACYGIKRFPAEGRVRSKHFWVADVEHEARYQGRRNSDVVSGLERESDRKDVLTRS